MARTYQVMGFTVEGRDETIAALERLHNILRSGWNRAPRSDEAALYEHFFGQFSQHGDLIEGDWYGRTYRLRPCAAARCLLDHFGGA